MRRLRWVILTLVLGPIAAGQPPDKAADETTIRATVAALSDYLTARAIGAIYTREATFLPPNMPRVSGEDGGQRLSEGTCLVKASLARAPAVMHVSGAIEQGRDTWAVPTHAGEQKDTSKDLGASRRTGMFTSSLSRHR